MRRGIVVSLAIALSPAAQAATWRVCLDGSSCDFASVAEAEEKAVDGDIIEIASGHYTQANLEITKSLTLRAASGADVTLYDPTEDAIGVSVAGITVTVEGLKLDSDGTSMQGIFASSGARVIGRNLTFLPHAQTGNNSGVHAYGTGTVIEISDSVFTDNDTTGADANDGAAILIQTGASGRFTRITVTGSNGGNAGAASIYNATATFTDATFQSNAGVRGGALRIEGTATAVTVDGSVFTSNSASGAGNTDGGGAIYVASGALTVTNSAFTSNGANTGGAIVVVGDATVSVSDTKFRQNTATSLGGALAYHNPGAVDLIGATFERNSGTRGGAAYIRDAGTTRIHRSRLCDNTATNGVGGALSIDGSAGATTLLNNLFIENASASLGGSALHYAPSSSATVRNNAFIGNRGLVAGGAVHFAQNAWTFENNLVAYTGAGDGLRKNTTGGSPAFAWNSFYGNTVAAYNVAGVATALPANHLTADPQLLAYTPGVAGDSGGCSAAWDFRTRAGAFLGNAGNTAVTDPDGSRSDIGPYGGPEAPSSAWVDSDGDGFRWVHDCDDTNPAVKPGASDTCNGVDDDCDGLIDENPTALWYLDADHDGVGGSGSSQLACTAPTGHVARGDDCDDADSDVFPGADEWCNGRSDDCDGPVDEEAVDATLWFSDTDGDTYGDRDADATLACDQPSGFVTDATDCDDTADTVHPGAAETCNDVDDDCDDMVDDDPTDGALWYADADGDLHGAAGVTTRACDQPVGHVALPGDCDDQRAAAHPGADEVCDGLDDDCDGEIDEDAIDPVPWYADADDDGYGSTEPGATTEACTAPDGYVAVGGDCDDAMRALHPGATESCNGLDDDCDGEIDVNVPGGDPWYRDVDGDGVGGDEVPGCDEAPDGYVADGGDCDDDDPDAWPGAPEWCDDVDQDCDGDAADHEDREAWTDGDGDGYGDAAVTTCEPPGDGVADAPGDCDDTDPSVSPGAEDPPGDGIDQDCDGADGPGDDGRPVPPSDTGDTDAASEACGCETRGAGAPPLLAAAAILLARRRRSLRQ